MHQLKDQTIIITGASKGIGAACVMRCLASGAKVVAAARHQQDLEQVQLATKEYASSVTIHAIDVSQEEQVNELFRSTLNQYGTINGLVQCAAIFGHGSIEMLDSSKWQQILNINLTGSFYGLKAAFKWMAENGSIVNLGSLSGVPGVEKFPGFAAYNVSKYGVLGLTEIAAVEGKEKNLRVNCVSPGAVDTMMLKQAAPQLPPAMEAQEVADIIAFLLSDKSRAINGENIVLTGHPAGPTKEK